MCHVTAAVCKKSYVEKYSVTFQNNYDNNYPSDNAARREKVKQLKSDVKSQQNTFEKSPAKAKASTVAFL